MLMTCALLDEIAVSKKFEENQANDVLQNIWTATDQWVNGHVFTEPVFLDGRNRQQQADVQVITFSDSALLIAKEEYRIEDFYKIVRSLKTHIERRIEEGTYCIIIRDEAIESHKLALGGYSGELNQVADYIHISVSGTIWVNLWTADEKIKEQKEWHDKYDLYCVDEKSKLKVLAEKEHCSFKGRDGKSHELLVLE